MKYEQIAALSKDSANLDKVALALETIPFESVCEVASKATGDKNWWLGSMAFAVVVRRASQLGTHCTREMFAEHRRLLGGHGRSD